MRKDEPLALKARFVFPVDRPPLVDGVVTLLGERIVAVGENQSGSPPIDLGNVAILPGLINAHTHLEFSNLPAPLGTAGNPLPHWLRRVVSQRRASESSDPRQEGLAECVRGGATSVGEIATRPWPETSLQPVADVTVFWEVIGLRPEHFDERLADARAHLERAWPEELGARAGLSPHAPYSVHPLLVEKLVGLAATANVPVAMHLAESREELELLANGSGAFRTLLDGLGVWPPKTFPRACVSWTICSGWPAHRGRWRFTAITWTTRKSIFWPRGPRRCRSPFAHGLMRISITSATPWRECWRVA